MNIAVKNIRSYLHFQQTEFALLLFLYKYHNIGFYQTPHLNINNSNLAFINKIFSNTHCI